VATLQKAQARVQISPHDHEGGVALCPAFADIRAAGFLTHRRQAMIADDAQRLLKIPAERCLHPQPGRLARDRVIRTVALFRVAQGGG